MDWDNDGAMGNVSVVLAMNVDDTLHHHQTAAEAVAWSAQDARYSNNFIM